jgi:hypothetical protein
MRKLLAWAGPMLLVLGLMAALPPMARADDDVLPPRVPFDLQVPRGNEPFLVGHGVGTQDYVCLPSASGVAWTLFTPEATLLDGDFRQVTTHFFSPNPAEDGIIRATWQHSRDTSTVWAKVIHLPSTDPAFVAPDAIPWLLLQVVGFQGGPTGGTALTAATYLQRVNTYGGVAPPTGCGSPPDVGAKAFVPYEADYFFFRKGGGERD